MIACIVGIVVGYFLAIPPGPIGVAAARTALTLGRGSARWLAVGAGVLDIAYCGVAVFASTGLSSVVLDGRMSGIAGGLGSIFQSVIAVAIIGVGVYQYRNPIELRLERSGATDAPSSRRATQGAPFAIGVGYAIANLANPTFIPSLILVTTFITGFDLFPTSPLQMSFFAIGFGIGNFLWLESLTRLVLHYHAHVPERMFVLIQRIMSGVVIVAGLTLGLKLLYLVPSTWYLVPST